MNALSFLQNCKNTPKQLVYSSLISPLAEFPLTHQRMRCRPRAFTCHFDKTQCPILFVYAFPFHLEPLHSWWSARVQHRCSSRRGMLYFSSSFREHMFPSELVPSFFQHLLVLHKQSSSALSDLGSTRLSQMSISFSDCLPLVNTVFR